MPEVPQCGSSDKVRKELFALSNLQYEVCRPEIDKENEEYC
jgi:hypothetical protein